MGPSPRQTTTTQGHQVDSEHRSRNELLLLCSSRGRLLITLNLPTDQLMGIAIYLSCQPALLQAECLEPFPFSYTSVERSNRAGQAGVYQQDLRRLGSSSFSLYNSLRPAARSWTFQLKDIEDCCPSLSSSR